MLLAEIGWATSALHFVPKPQQHTNLFSSASRKKIIYIGLLGKTFELIRTQHVHTLAQNEVW